MHVLSFYRYFPLVTQGAALFFYCFLITFVSCSSQPSNHLWRVLCVRAAQRLALAVFIFALFFTFSQLFLRVPCRASSS